MTNPGARGDRARLEDTRTTPWRIFYDNGTTFGSGDGPPSEAPVLGVVAIVQRVVGELRPQVLHQVDFYWWLPEGCWRGGDWMGLVDNTALGATWTKAGRTIRTETYRAILGAAVELSHEWEVGT